jgi:DNA-binding CsgD family transcriptional regulator
MARARQAKCNFGQGPHDMEDPRNQRWHVTPHGTKVRSCRPCALARERNYRKEARERAARERAKYNQLEWKGPKRITSYTRERIRAKTGITVPAGIRLQYKPNEQDFKIMQMYADGFSHYEIANVICLSPRSVDMQMQMTRIKYGVHSTAEVIAQGLKRGAIRPDKVRGKMVPRRSNRVRGAIAELKRIINGAHIPRSNTPKYAEICEPLGASSIPHAVSIAWAAGRLTSRHVPQTRNHYTSYTSKGARNAPKGGGARWKN